MGSGTIWILRRFHGYEADWIGFISLYHTGLTSLAGSFFLLSSPIFFCPFFFFGLVGMQDQRPSHLPWPLRSNVGVVQNGIASIALHHFAMMMMAAVKCHLSPLFPSNSSRVQ